MTRTELIIQLLKLVIGLAFAAYFVWWSLQVLDRLTPEVDGPTAMVGRIFKSNPLPIGPSSMWTLAFHHEDRKLTHGYAAPREAAMAASAITIVRAMSKLETWSPRMNRFKRWYVGNLEEVLQAL